MEKEILPKTINMEQETVDSEAKLNLKADLKNDGAGYNSPVVAIKSKFLSVLRIRRFFIRQSRSRRPMEFGVHPHGIHWMGQAIFHSESGCAICKTDLEEIS